MKKLLQEFKNFAIKGNAFDLAVGVIIGAAFGKIVSSIVADLIMPLVSILTGGVKFDQLALTLKPASEGAEALLWKYGSFLQTLFDFLIIAICIFLLVKGMSLLAKKEETKEAPPAEPSEEILLLREIRDALKGKEPAAAETKAEEPANV